MALRKEASPVGSGTHFPGVPIPLSLFVFPSSCLQGQVCQEISPSSLFSPFSISFLYTYHCSLLALYSSFIFIYYVRSAVSYQEEIDVELTYLKEISFLLCSSLFFSAFVTSSLIFHYIPPVLENCSGCCVGFPVKPLWCTCGFICLLVVRGCSWAKVHFTWASQVNGVCSVHVPTKIG